MNEKDIFDININKMFKLLNIDHFNISMIKDIDI